MMIKTADTKNHSGRYLICHGFFLFLYSWKLGGESSVLSRTAGSLWLNSITPSFVESASYHPSLEKKIKQNSKEMEKLLIERHILSRIFPSLFSPPSSRTLLGRRFSLSAFPRRGGGTLFFVDEKEANENCR